MYSLKVFHISKENSKFIISVRSSSYILDFIFLFYIPENFNKNNKFPLTDIISRIFFAKIKIPSVYFTARTKSNLILD